MYDERGTPVIKARVERGTEKENVRIVHVDVDPEMVNRYMDQAFHELRKDVTIPGFRKGRIPRVLFERRFGREVIWEEALEKLLPDAYGEAIEDLDLEPIGPPNVDLKDADSEEDSLSFTAEIEVRPEVKLGEFREIEVDLDIQEVTDEDVEETLHRLRDSRSSVTAVEDEDATVVPGMLAVVDFQGYDGDEPLEELHGEEMLIEVGSGSNIPGFDEGILGARAKEKRTFSVELPADTPLEDLAGSEVRFEVEIKELQVKELPALDDEFAREFFGDDSVEELRENYREYMINDNEQSALAELESQVVSQVVDGAEIEVPEVMVEQVVDQKISDFEYQMGARDLSLEDLLRERGYDSEDDLREELRGPAEKGVREILVLEAVADQEAVEVSEEEVEAELERHAGSMGIDPGIFLRTPTGSGLMQEVRNSCRLRKTREFLASLSCPEYDEVKERVARREERWQREKEERVAQQELDDDSAKDEAPGVD